MINLYSKTWEIENIDTVIFDKDGTFIDSHLYWGRIIARRINAVIDYYDIEKKYFDDLCLALGYDTKLEMLIEQGPIALLPREEIICSLLNTLDKLGVEAESSVIDELFKKEHKLFQSEIYDYIKILDGAKELFSKLKEKNVKLAVVTSDAYENTIQILEYLEIKDYFNLVMGKEACTEPKRTGKPAIKALDILKSKIENSICVGDAPMDSDMGRNANLKACILVSTGQIPRCELDKHSSYTVNSLKEVNIK